MFTQLFRKKEEKSDADALLDFANTDTADKAPDPFHVTESAAKQIKSLVSDEKNATGLRIFVQGGGCSGFQYIWDYKKNWPDVKWSDPIDDLLVLDPMAEMFVFGCTVDYVKELGGSYLKVVNPNATASCGCGESFAV